MCQNKRTSPLLSLWNSPKQKDKSGVISLCWTPAYLSAIYQMTELNNIIRSMKLAHYFLLGISEEMFWQTDLGLIRVLHLKVKWACCSLTPKIHHSVPTSKPFPSISPISRKRDDSFSTFSVFSNSMVLAEWFILNYSQPLSAYHRDEIVLFLSFFIILYSNIIRMPSRV